MADGSIHIDTKIDNSGIDKGLGKLESKLQSGVKGIGSKIGNGLERIGKLATTAITVATTATVGFAAAATKAGIEFESAFAGVKKTIDGTPEYFEELRRELMETAEEIPVVQTELAGIAEAAGQLGIEKDNLMAFTKVMANLGVSTNMSADQAATALARMAEITGMPQEKFENLGSTVVDLGNKFATTESEIVEMGLRIAGAGNMVGLSTDQILALSAAMSSVGIYAEAGGSAVSTVFSLMKLAIDENGDALKGFAKIAGMTTSEFKRAFEEDAAQALVAFVEGLDDTERHGKSAIGALDKLGSVQGYTAISSITVRDALLRLNGASGLLTETLQVGATAWENNTALAEEAGKRYETLESKIQLFKNTLNNLMYVLSDSWRSVVANFVTIATNIVSTMRKTFEEEGFPGLARCIGEGIQGLLDYILEYIPNFATVALEILKGIAAAFVKNLPQIIDMGSDLLAALLDGIEQGIPLLIEAMPKILLAIRNFFQENVQELIRIGWTLLEVILDGITAAIPIINEYLPYIIGAITIFFEENSDQIAYIGYYFIDVLAKSIVDAFPSLDEILSGFVDGIFDSILAKFGIRSKHDKTGEVLVSGVAEGMERQRDGYARYVEEYFSETSEYAKAGIGTEMDKYGNLIVERTWWGMEQKSDTYHDHVKNFFKGTPTYAYYGIGGNANGNGTNALSGVGQSIIDGAIQGMDSREDAFKTEVANVFKTAEPTAATVLDSHSPSKVFAEVGANIISGSIKGISTNLRYLINEVSADFKQIITTASNALNIGRSGSGHFQSVGRSIVDGVQSGIESRRSSFTSKITSFFSGIVSSVKSTLGIHSPSTVFRDIIGKNIGLGAIKGIVATKPQVDKAMSELLTPKSASDFIVRMRAGVANSTARTAGAVGAAASNAAKSPTAAEIASAIWDKAPPLDVNMNGEKVGEIVEPYVSEKQAEKTNMMNRRNGLVFV